MFLQRLSSSFVPRSRPAFCRASLRSSSVSHTSSSSSVRHPLPPGPRPRWPLQGYPPWPPRLLHPHPADHQVCSQRTLHTSAGLRMEQHDRDRGPPYKRRKSTEEKRSSEGKEGGVTRGKAKDGGSIRENHIYIQHYNRCKDAGKGVSQAGERIQTGDKHSQQKGSTSQEGRGGHQRVRQGDPQLKECRTQPPKSKPDQDKAPAHKPNPWFKESCAEERRASEGSPTGPERQSRDESRTGFPQTPCQVAGAQSEPPPPGTCSPDRQQEEVKLIKSLQRHWEASPICSTDPEPPGCSTAFDFSVMSYNILSQDLLHDNAYLYRHCQPDVLQWTRRLPNLLAEIQEHDADILCLQEVQENHYENQIKPALQALGYQCEYKKRTGMKPDGCAIIFKTSRLSLLSSNPIEYFRPGDTLLDRDNIGLVLLLQPNNCEGRPELPTPICVANTHLLYNPRRGDIKLAQLAILLAEINQLSCQPDGLTNPVVLCGDFNSTPESPLYRFLTSGFLMYKGMQASMVSGQESIHKGQRLLLSPIWSHSLGIDYQCQYNKPTSESPSSPTAVEGAISNLTVEDLATTAAAAASNKWRIEHPLKLQSSYQHFLMPDGRPEITTCHSRTAMTVDYILYTPELTTPPSLPGGWGLQLLGRLSLVGKAELKKVNGLPNRHHSSDHLPLLSRFRLRR